MLFKNTSTFLEELERAGVEYELFEHKHAYSLEDLNKLLPDNKEDFIPYVPLGLAKKIHRMPFSWNYNFDDFAVSNYLSSIPKDEYLNSDFIMGTFGDFKNNPHKYLQLFSFKTDGVFLRPNGGNKVFSGFCLNPFDDIHSQINALEKTSGVVNETLILISGYKPIDREYRAVIINGKMIDVCQYMDGVEVCEGRSLPEGLKEYIAKISNHTNMLEVYVLDIAMMNESFKVLEINCFHTAGLYALDYAKVFTEVKKFYETSY